MNTTQGFSWMLAAYLGACLVSHIAADAMCSLPGIQAESKACKEKVSTCDAIATSILSDPKSSNDLRCEKLTEMMYCLHNLTSCVSQVVLRIRFLQTEEVLTALNLDNCRSNMATTFFPVSDEPCQEGRQACVVSYVESLRPRTRDGGQDKDRVCQALAHYVTCLQGHVEGCGTGSEHLVDNSEIEEILATEMARMDIKGCVIPTMASGLSAEQCHTARRQCAAVRSDASVERSYDSLIEALRCIANLDCNSKDVTSTIDLLLDDN